MPKAMRERRRDKDHSRGAMPTGPSKAQKYAPRLAGNLPTNSCGSRFSTSGLSCKDRQKHKEVSLAPAPQLLYAETAQDNRGRKEGEGIPRVSDAWGEGLWGSLTPLLPSSEQLGCSSRPLQSLLTASSRDQYHHDGGEQTPASVTRIPGPSRCRPLASHPRTPPPQPGTEEARGGGLLYNMKYQH